MGTGNPLITCTGLERALAFFWEQRVKYWGRWKHGCIWFKEIVSDTRCRIELYLSAGRGEWIGLILLCPVRGLDMGILRSCHIYIFSPTIAPSSTTCHGTVQGLTAGLLSFCPQGPGPTDQCLQQLPPTSLVGHFERGQHRSMGMVSEGIIFGQGQFCGLSWPHLARAPPSFQLTPCSASRILLTEPQFYGQVYPTISGFQPRELSTSKRFEQNGASGLERQHFAWHRGLSSYWTINTITLSSISWLSREWDGRLKSIIWAGEEDSFQALETLGLKVGHKMKACP